MKVAGLVLFVGLRACRDRHIKRAVEAASCSAFLRAVKSVLPSQWRFYGWTRGASSLKPFYVLGGGLGLDWVVSVVFSYPNDSMILF